MDDRNRITVPAKWREHFADAPAVLVRGQERCIVVYTKESHDAAAEIIRAMDSRTAEGRDEQRRFFGNSYSVKKDAQSRLLVERPLIDWASLTQNVRIVGLGDRFEIWERGAHAAYEASLAARG